MNPMLTRSQQKTICSQLGRVKLQLLYKASIHGFTGAAFHQRCDNHCPTVSVGYNNSGYVFGGYTKQAFNQSGQYVHDDQAFLFTFSGEKLLKYPVTGPANAVRMMGNCGPYFGEALVLVNGSKAVVHTNPGNYYNFDAAEMHGNDLNLTECEVYQVEETTELERPWRTIAWESGNKKELMESIKSYKPTVSSVSQARVLLIGPVGAGKSSFFNSINSVFRGHVTSQAIAGCSTTSLTTQFRTYSLKAGREGKPLPIILCDTMGLEESTGAGLDIDDISSILKGHLPDRYQFNPSAPLHSEAHGHRKSPGLKDKIHCVAYVIDACKVSIMPTKLEEKLDAIRRKVNLMGIPQLVLLTKVDEACPLVAEDVRNLYKSGYIKEMMQEVSARVGVPLSCVVPVKNYSQELELDLNCDIVLLSAVIQMLRFADNYFDEISDLFSNINTKERSTYVVQRKRRHTQVNFKGSRRSETSAEQLITMNPMLTKSRQKTICSQFGSVKLQLLYKASIHGFTGAAFHQRCDNHCPTVSVGYNTSGYVFGGYTKQAFNQSGQYVHDDEAFLFTFSGEKLLKYPITNPAYAVRMKGKSGPYFGEALVLVSGSQAVVYSSPGNYYNFDAAEMHGNDLNLTECEVYQVEASPEFEKPWRPMVWENEKRTEMMETIKLYCPIVSSVSQARVLLIGPVGAGKSSFFNSISSVFRGHVTSQAIAGCSTTSLTTQLRTYSVKAGRAGKPLPIILCDTMGLEESTGAGLDVDDIISILKGHLPDRYQFNPSAPLDSEAPSYRKSPGLEDKIHCVAYVIDACKVSIMSTKLEQKLETIRRKVNLMGIPQLVLMTKVDEACPFVSQDIRDVYRSGYIKEMMQEVSVRVGVPVSCVVPVKNYSQELELDLNCDILLLNAVIQMLRFADDYFDELSDRFSNTQTKE